MPKPQSKKTKARIEIQSLINKGYSANKIQIALKEKGLGVRRKRLLSEIRLIKTGKTGHKKDMIKYIPRKYRRKTVPVPVVRRNIIPLYRVSYIIQDVPVHSRPFQRNYIGFRLTAFHINRTVLDNNSTSLKNKLLKFASRYLGYNILDWEYYDVYIGIEYPTQISANIHLSGTFDCKVEKNGYEIHVESGRI